MTYVRLGQRVAELVWPLYCHRKGAPNLPPDSPRPQLIRPTGTRDYSWALYSAAFAPLILGIVFAVVTVFFVPVSAPKFLLGEGFVVYRILLFVSGIILVVMGVLLLRRSTWMRSLVESDAHPGERGALVAGIGLAICVISATQSFRY